MVEKGKKVAYLIWLLLVIGLVITYFTNPAILTPSYIVEFIQKFNGEMMLMYIFLTLIRGFFLIPSTPFVICGALLFPDKLFLVLSISMIGVMFSATTLYYFSDMLGFSKYFKAKKTKKINLWEARLKSPKSIFFVTGWSLFPFVPTDLICYVAGIVKMPFKNMFIGVFLGELILDIFYVYFGANLVEVLL